METLNSLLAGLGAAVFAFAATAAFANHALRKERGFDRRLQWCERALGAFHQAGAAVVSARKAEDGAHAEACWTEVIRCYEELIPIYGQRWLYASHEASLLIAKFMRTLQALIESHLESEDGDSLHHACRACLGDLKEAGAELSRIARGHLRFGMLEELEADYAFDVDSMFTGSFRGRTMGAHGERNAPRSS